VLHIHTPLHEEPTLETIRDEILAKLTYAVGKHRSVAENHDWLWATILALRDHVIDDWMESTRRAEESKAKRVYYLSLEFLVGRMLRDALNNLNLQTLFQDALNDLNVKLDLIELLEPDPALGNGGLGRLAACFMESMASLDIPAHGYGIRYNHGLFRQKIESGWQTEFPEQWLQDGNPWEFPRRETAYKVGFGGQVAITSGVDVMSPCRWSPSEVVVASACDLPMVGWRGKRVNPLRLWTARSVDPIILNAFNSGDYVAALSESNRAAIISRVLYPSDSTPAGQELRLRQEYFFTSASLQDIIHRHLKSHGDIRSLKEKAAIQLNDTHPAIAVAELMRLLLDQHGLPWNEAWDITIAVTSYTNHTLLPEALESWPVHLFESMLPCHMQIIYAINARMIAQAQERSSCSLEYLSSISLIDENGGRRVRMVQLAFVGSHSIHGISALHTNLMKESVFRDLDQLYPGRINNKTNGITPRRWLFNINPALTNLLHEITGDQLYDDLESIRSASESIHDSHFRDRYQAIKLAHKVRLSNHVRQELGIAIDPHAMFDVQAKRIHEYKRQLLNILETISLYNAMRTHPGRAWAPRVKIFSGKAASSYAQAKLIIKLINDVANVINNDPLIGERLKVIFLPNYNVSLAELLVPAADLSEQISTAGMEASGTGNMKFALNGALTIGPLDGANIEMMERVGSQNIAIFGMTAEQVNDRRRNGYQPRMSIEGSADLTAVLAALDAGVYSPDDLNRFKPITHALSQSDWFMVAADFSSYQLAQRRIDEIWNNRTEWIIKTIINTINMGWFSSDRTIREYAREIWNVPVE